ncbi:MAG: glycoside hydrolase family 16 protein, partial [Fulvivirga sp.]
MKTFVKILLACICALMVISCAEKQSSEESQTTTEENAAGLVWSDEFNYSGAPDSTKWSYDLGDGCPNVCGWGNNELEYYTSDSKNVRVENGNLIIEVHK